jgi:hypothetical protein
VYVQDRKFRRRRNTTRSSSVRSGTSQAFSHLALILTARIIDTLSIKGEVEVLIQSRRSPGAMPVDSLSGAK